MYDKYLKIQNLKTTSTIPNWWIGSLIDWMKPFLLNFKSPTVHGFTGQDQDGIHDNDKYILLLKRRPEWASFYTNATVSKCPQTISGTSKSLLARIRQWYMFKIFGQIFCSCGYCAGYIR